MTKNGARRERKEEVQTPSPFGSHTSMKRGDPLGGLAVLRDKDGSYVTKSEKLDNGLADPERYAALAFRITRRDAALLAHGFESIEEFDKLVKPPEEDGQG